MSTYRYCRRHQRSGQRREYGGASSQGEEETTDKRREEGNAYLHRGRETVPPYSLREEVLEDCGAVQPQHEQNASSKGSCQRQLAAKQGQQFGQ